MRKLRGSATPGRRCDPTHPLRSPGCGPRSRALSSASASAPPTPTRHGRRSRWRISPDFSTAVVLSLRGGAMGRLAFLSHHRSLVVGIGLLLLPVSAWGQGSAAQRATLKGVNTVEVVVEAMDPVAERDGLTRAQLQTDVEERLRQAGI